MAEIDMEWINNLKGSFSNKDAENYYEKIIKKLDFDKEDVDFLLNMNIKADKGEENHWKVTDSVRLGVVLKKINPEKFMELFKSSQYYDEFYSRFKKYLEI